MKVGASFNTLEDDDEDKGTTLVNKRANKYSGPPCTCCRRNNYPTDKCFAMKKADGTAIHMGIEHWRR